MTDAPRTVVITGASSGFGKEMAQAFLGEGWRTFATLRAADGRNKPAADELRALGAEVVELDVTDTESVERAAAEIHTAAGAVDVLVNNAGNSFFGITEAFTPEAVERQFATNVFGALRVNRAFLGAMRNRRSGLIVYISSVVGRIVLPFGGVYCASKWALEALAEAASYELRPFGVEVGIVEPGAFSTNISASRTGPDDQARVAAYGESAKAGLAVGGTLVEMAKGHAPSEVAHAVVALAKATPGTRPLRTVVDFGLTAAAEINARIAPLQSDTLLQFGVGQLAAPA